MDNHSQRSASPGIRPDVLASIENGTTQVNIIKMKQKLAGQEDMIGKFKAALQINVCDNGAISGRVAFKNFQKCAASDTRCTDKGEISTLPFCDGKLSFIPMDGVVRSAVSETRFRVATQMLANLSSTNATPSR